MCACIALGPSRLLSVRMLHSLVFALVKLLALTRRSPDSHIYGRMLMRQSILPCRVRYQRMHKH